jgi:hypothetical protein
LQETEKLVAFRDAFREGLIERMGFVISDDYALKYPSFKKDIWLEKVDIIGELLKELIPRFSEQDD